MKATFVDTQKWEAITSKLKLRFQIQIKELLLGSHQDNTLTQKKEEKNK